MPASGKSELSISSVGYSDLMNVTTEVTIDIDDLVHELEGTPRGYDLGEKLLTGVCKSIEEVALGLEASDLANLVEVLMGELPEDEANRIASEYCQECQERATLFEEVERIEEERRG